MPRCELAPPPLPFMVAPCAPLPKRSTHAFMRGIASWGGNLRIVLRISLGSVWARHISKSRLSDECSACINVRVNEFEGMSELSALAAFFFDFFRLGSGSFSSLSELASNWFSETAANLCPKDNSATSASSEPSTSRCVNESRISLAWPRSSPDPNPSEEGSLYRLFDIICRIVNCGRTTVVLENPTCRPSSSMRS